MREDVDLLRLLARTRRRSGARVVSLRAKEPALGAAVGQRARHASAIERAESRSSGSGVRRTTCEREQRAPARRARACASSLEPALPRRTRCVRHWPATHGCPARASHFVPQLPQWRGSLLRFDLAAVVGVAVAVGEAREADVRALAALAQRASAAGRAAVRAAPGPDTLPARAAVRASTAMSTHRHRCSVVPARAEARAVRRTSGRHRTSFPHAPQLSGSSRDRSRSRRRRDVVAVAEARACT